MIDRVFFKQEFKRNGDYCVFLRFIRRSVDGKHLMRFQSETSVFKFLRRGVDDGSFYHEKGGFRLSCPKSTGFS